MAHLFLQTTSKKYKGDNMTPRKQITPQEICDVVREIADLRIDIDHRFESAEVLRLESARLTKTALDAAQISMEKRLDGMNEFRDSLKDQAAKFITREEMLSTLRAIQTNVEILLTSKATEEGKASQKSLNITMIIAITGVVLSIFKFFIK
jgi:hypothetical protein